MLSLIIFNVKVLTQRGVNCLHKAANKIFYIVFFSEKGNMWKNRDSERFMRSNFVCFITICLYTYFSKDATSIKLVLLSDLNSRRSKSYLFLIVFGRQNVQNKKGPIYPILYEVLLLQKIHNSIVSFITEAFVR